MNRNVEIPEGPFQPDWDSLEKYSVPRWYEDGKFGIFIHWGPYCVPAFNNEWYPRNMYLQESPVFEHHRATYGDHREFGYKDFIDRFTAEKFNAVDWAILFRRSGARFVMPVAEHHDGFAMYDTELSDWNAKKMGPKRDIVGELARAVRDQWLVFGLSSHRAEHWWFFDGGMKFPSDVRDPRFAGLYGPAQPRDTQPNEEFLDDWLARTCELVDKYQPQVVWFDWWIEQPAFEPYLRKFAAYYYNRGAQWGKGVAINYKNESFRKGSAVFDVERGQLDEVPSMLWQTDTSVSRSSWCYVNDHKYKETGEIVRDLIDIVSKNGALLLNIGPKPDGTIPEPEQKMLLEIGAWLGLNGEAVYDTRPWTVYGEGPTAVTSGGFTDKAAKSFTARDIRFTRKGDTVYAAILAKPENGVATIKSLGTDLRLYRHTIGRVELLGYKGDIKWSHGTSGLRVTIPDDADGEHAWVVKVTPKK